MVAYKQRDIQNGTRNDKQTETQRQTVGLTKDQYTDKKNRNRDRNQT